MLQAANNVEKTYFAGVLLLAKKEVLVGSRSGRTVSSSKIVMLFTTAIASKYGLDKYKLGSGDFSENARGRWYFNVTNRIKQPHLLALL